MAAREGLPKKVMEQRMELSQRGQGRGAGPAEGQQVPGPEVGKAGRGWLSLWGESLET